MDHYLGLGNLDPANAIALAQVAEAVGFAGVALPDHLCMPLGPRAYPYTSDGLPPFETTAPWPDVWVLIGAMAAVTDRLRFRTSIYVLALRHPVVAARAIGTAAAIAPGRIDVGVGAGWLAEEFAQVGADFEARGAVTDEGIRALRSLLRSGAVAHRGERWHIGPVHLEPAPPQPVPILVGGMSGPALRRAVTLGDGLIAPALPVSESVELLTDVEQACATNGRQRASFHFHARTSSVPTRAELEVLGCAGVDAVQVPLPRGPAPLNDRIREVGEYARVAGLRPERRSGGL